MHRSGTAAAPLDIVCRLSAGPDWLSSLPMAHVTQVGTDGTVGRRASRDGGTKLIPAADGVLHTCTPTYTSPTQSLVACEPGAGTVRAHCHINHVFNVPVDTWLYKTRLACRRTQSTLCLPHTAAREQIPAEHDNTLPLARRYSSVL